MLEVSSVILISFAYLVFLFLVAFIANRLADSNKTRFINSPLVYTLSLTVYCTSWTFYGAVGSAARNGLEFLTIYLGPSLIFFGWWFIMRKLVRISKNHRITSIADFISSRFGKSTRLAAMVTIMAVVGTTPYIALQLKAVAKSFETITSAQIPVNPSWAFYSDTGFWVALAMGVFIVLFGTRRIGVDEHHHGVVAAIAIESLVKLFAFLAVGIFVLLMVHGPDGNILQTIQNNPKMADKFVFPENAGPRWVTMLILSAAAIICLPRQFQVAVVEITDEKNLKQASWLFPFYLFLISLFVIPIAVAGLTILPPGSDPDQFLLTLPMQFGQETLTLLAFIGGFSSATSMMIMATMALSIMISNQLVMPLVLKMQAFDIEKKGDITPIILTIRRLAILFVLVLGYLYYTLSRDTEALASIGLVSFAAAAQFLPIILGGVFWKNATELGAFLGLGAGFLIWAFTMLVPVFDEAGYLHGVVENGLFGLSYLRPQGLFGTQGWDPLVHALFWSYTANISTFVVISLFFKPRGLERLQAALFVDVFKHPVLSGFNPAGYSAHTGELLALSQRILGVNKTRFLFQRYTLDDNPTMETDPHMVEEVERQLAGSIGAASARIMVSRIAVGDAIGIDEMIKILGETQQAIAYSRELENKSTELKQTMVRLQQANRQLTMIDKQKDDFLSHVSHELRTPMTAISSFSEILLDSDDMSVQERCEYLKIIVKESQRLTRLLDDILDFNLLQNGYGFGQIRDFNPADTLAEAIASLDGLVRQKKINLVDLSQSGQFEVRGDPDRLKQVYINILSNAIKFCDELNPKVIIETVENNDNFLAIFTDNGPGIAPEDHNAIFTKFERKRTGAQGAGLGLAISKQIIHNMNGEIHVRSNLGKGASFIVSTPAKRD